MLKGMKPTKSLVVSGIKKSEKEFGSEFTNAQNSYVKLINDKLNVVQDFGSC